jgi:hypothetical protein
MRAVLDSIAEEYRYLYKPNLNSTGSYRVERLTKKAAQEILAAVDAWGGKPKSEAQLKKFGYVKTEGGVWELPTHILKAAGTTRKMAQRR